MKHTHNAFYVLITLPFLFFLGGYITLTRYYPIQEFETPNLVGKQIQDILSTLGKQNLNIRIIAQKEDADLPNGTVIQQNPPARQKIKSHQSLFLVVSKQPEAVLMPNVIGKQRQEISHLLQQYNMVATYYEVPGTKPAGQCIAQFPEAGTPIIDKKVIIYVSTQEQTPVIMPLLQGMNINDAQEMMALYPVTLEIINQQTPAKKHFHTTQTISDQRPLAGSILYFKPENKLHVQVLVQ